MKEKIRVMLKTEFEQRLFDEAINNLSSDSKIRFSNFAYVIRELVRHILDRLAPDADVKSCKWFVLHDKLKPKMITRAQKISFSLHGGLTDTFIDDLDIDVTMIQEKIKSCFVLLSKYTHLNPEVYDIDKEKIHEMSRDIINTIFTLFENIKRTKEQIISAVEDSINKSVLENLYFDTIDSIDCLSTHSTPESFCIDDIKIHNISNEYIYMHVSGSVNIKMQYGSDGDIKRDDGHIMYNSFPFYSNVTAKIADNILLLEFITDSFEVDTD